MKKLAVIKSERAMNQVTKIMVKKLRNKVAIYHSYEVSVEEYLKGRINHIVIKSKSHMLTKVACDSAWEVIDEYEAKYGQCIYGTIQTRPYYTSDGKYELHQPVIEIGVRVYEKR